MNLRIYGCIRFLKCPLRSIGLVLDLIIFVVCYNICVLLKILQFHSSFLRNNDKINSVELQFPNECYGGYTGLSLCCYTLDCAVMNSLQRHQLVKETCGPNQGCTQNVRNVARGDKIISGYNLILRKSGAHRLSWIDAHVTVDRAQITIVRWIKHVHCFPIWWPLHWDLVNSLRRER